MPLPCKWLDLRAAGWPWRISSPKEMRNSCLPFKKHFRKIRLQDRLGRSSRNFPGATELLKRQSCFSGQNVLNGNSCSIYFKAIFDTSFTPSQPFFGKWNWFVQMVNSSPRRNSLFLNFAHHLPKPWTNLFAQYVKAKQPESWSSTFVLNTLRPGSDAVLFMSRT